MARAWIDVFRYQVGWTEADDEDWEGLMWDAWRSASLDESKRRAESLSRTNPGWQFIVYDTYDEDIPFIATICEPQG